MCFLKTVEERFGQSVFNATEGFKIAVLKQNQVVFKKAYGKTYQYYDLASLTKIIYTVSALEFLNEYQVLLPEHKVKSYIPDWKNPNTQIKHLLTHSAGLDWWRPFYKKLSLNLSSEQKKQSVYEQITNSPSKLSLKSQYSDLDFILLNHLIEKVMEQSADQVFEMILKSIGTPDIFFHKDNKPKYKTDLYAPTENCPWRKKQLQAQVHDDNTWAMGGVSGHAGLFGSLEAVVQWGQAFYDALHNGHDCWARSQTIKKYTKRAVPSRSGDWALGYMMPTPGRASCGKHFSKQSIGHTGFVGTSFWHDPKHKFTVIILSNRVYPTRENQLFVKLRPVLHDVAYEHFNVV